MSAPQDTGLRIAAAALAWLAGIGLQMQQPALWPLATYGVSCGAALALLGFGRRLGRRDGPGAAIDAAVDAAVAVGKGGDPGAAMRRGVGNGPAALLCLWLGLLGLAFGSTGWRATVRLAQVLPAALEGRDLQLIGVVARMPQPGPQGTRFVFDIEQATLDGSTVTVPRRVALGWYRGFDGDGLIAGAPPDLRAGQRWQLTARLAQPHGTLNPHGFDLELWLFEQGIGASGTVRAATGTAARLLADDGGAPVERARQSVRDAILLRVHDAQAAGVLAALTVGDQAAIERDDWQLFRDTGVAHLMSISGLHVTMFAWLAALASGPLWRRSARLMLWCPAPTAARWGGVLAAGAYAWLAGWGVPAQRTLWMLAAVALLRTIGVHWPAPLILLVAAVVVTLLDPWAVMQPGFWLSFVAVGLLMASDPLAARGAPPLRRDHRLWAAVRAGLRTQAVASIGLAPLSLVFFQQVSLVGFVANLVAIPLVTLVVTPLALLGVLLPPLWAAAALLVQGLVAWLGWLERWPFGVWAAAAAPTWAVASGLLGGLLLVAPLPWRLRLLGLPLLLPLAAPPQRPPADGAFEAVVADIGQGTAVLVRTHAHLLLYDAGPKYGAEADAAQRVLLPLLHARGEDAVDVLLLSHSDTDHVGGAASLLAQRPVRALLSSLPATHPLRGRGLPHRRCQAGQSWQWDGVRFDILHPPADGAAPGAKPNALSCVLRVQARDGRSLLLAGDIEAAQEAALVERLGAAGLRSQVLLVPHHGSRTSSTEAFVAAVAPGTAVVQAAYRSRFGHPAPEVVARYQALGVELLRSDQCGAWTWDGQGSTRCERDVARRYWHHRPVHGPPPAS